MKVFGPQGVVRGMAWMAVAALLSVFLPGAFRVCLCDEDPDGCGRACHVCVEERPAAVTTDCAGTAESASLSAAEDCRHLVIEVGDLSSSADEVQIPMVAATVDFSSVACRRLSPPGALRFDSTAPPDSGGCYRTYSTRLNPLS